MQERKLASLYCLVLRRRRLLWWRWRQRRCAISTASSHEWHTVQAVRTITKAKIKKVITTLMKAPILTEALGLYGGCHTTVARLPVGRGIRGVIMLLTSPFTTAVKAAPIIIPTAKSTTFPRRMKALKSPNQFFACCCTSDTVWLFQVAIKRNLQLDVCTSIIHQSYTLSNTDEWVNCDT